MRRLLVSAVVFSCAAAGAQAAPPLEAAAGPNCDELRASIVETRTRASRLRAEVGEAEMTAVVLPGAALGHGFDRFDVEMRPRVTSRSELARQARQESAQRRLRAAETRLGRLAGLYLAHACRVRNPVPERPAGPGETALGAAD